ncbi:unnamed protein product [Rotaria socialis]|uniref:Uncharacterized protein n=2 Tax=Rotaria socialis TaxID=392032 RepID=A0A821EE76_9BILA|nr:unnamed protein product [Rotaria socialis]CAF4538946.1 unnamed protein product [Rotaria socialis]CAF4634901.1 unnamed protein product [Rotaria socialis]CAF4913693.1 unnamed protein product [Rotaria socialis]
MILFEMIEFFGVINKKWTISKPITTLDTLIQFMDKFHFNAIQLGANPTQFLFYHPDGERYGLCDLRTLSSSSTKFKGVQLHQMNEEDIDERVLVVCRMFLGVCLLLHVLLHSYRLGLHRPTSIHLVGTRTNINRYRILM